MGLLGDLITKATWPDVTAYVAIGLFSIIVYRRYSTSLRTIPGPILASFTRFWHVYHIIVGDQNIALIKLHKKHGHFVRVSHNEVSVSHPDGIREILLASLEKAPWYRIMAIPDYRFQTPFSTLNPKHKIERSKRFASGYALSNLIQAESAMDGHFECLKSWLDAYAEQCKPMDLDKFITYATYDVAGEALFSRAFGFLKAGTDVDNAISNNEALSLYAAVAGFYYRLHTILFGNPLVTRAGLLPMGRLFNATVTALNERRQNEQARFDMVGHWLKSLGFNPDPCRIRDIYAHTINSVGACETISVAVQSFFYHMIRHPAALQRVRAEINGFRASGRCQSSVISFADAQDLHFLQACVKESMRLFSPVTMSMARVAGEGGVTIGDRFFPRGTILSVNAWVMHHSTECWGPLAEDFDPDRWTAIDSASQAKHFIPFGAGYASCPGQNLARIEIFKLCATLARDYDIHQVDNNQEWKWKARLTARQSSWPVYVQRASRG